MIYFVNVFFQQNDGAIGHTSANFTDINTARMEYHAQLASQYNPASSVNNAWMSVQLMEYTGFVVLSETAKFEKKTSEAE